MLGLLLLMVQLSVSGGSSDDTPMAGAASGLVAEPQIVEGRFTTATEVKPILDMTRGNWVALRDFNGQDLLYVTHILAWRCGLLELHVGLNGAPTEPWPLPECHLDTSQPNAMVEGDGLPYRAYPPGSIQSIRVELVLDDLSRLEAEFPRAMVMMP